MKSFNIIWLVIFSSCVTIKDAGTIKFKYYEGMKSHKIIMQVPKDFKLIKIYTGGEGEEHRYWYSDSSLIYISDAKGLTSYNEQLIRQQEGAYSRKFLSDSIMLKGTNEKGSYWEEIKYKGLLYGYSNVPPDKKQLYDNAMSSVKFK